MSCNTNNGTERINGDLKHDELVGFKNCSLSDLYEIIIPRFLPKFYRKYVSLNVKFSSGYKTYAENIPSYLQNRPQSLVTFLLERAQRMSTLMIDTVKEQTYGSFEVFSDDPGISDTKLKYNVSFGDHETFCSCSCRDFRRTKLLCKHFFAIIDSRIKQFSDLTKLFLNSFTNLDRGLFEDNEINNVADPTLIKDNWKKCKEKIEEKHVIDIMDLSDFENASGKNSFCFFSISYSGSDKFLFCLRLCEFDELEKNSYKTLIIR